MTLERGGCAGLGNDGRRCKGVVGRKLTSPEVGSRVWVIGMRGERKRRGSTGKSGH
jgi:hypothetical protein